MSQKSEALEIPKELSNPIEQLGQAELFDVESAESPQKKRTLRSSSGLKHVVNDLSSRYKSELYDLLSYEMQSVFLALFLPASYKGKCYTNHELLEFAKKTKRDISFEMSAKEMALVASPQFEALYKAVNTGLRGGHRQELVASLDKYSVEIFKAKKHHLALATLLSVSVKTIHNIRKGMLK